MRVARTDRIQISGYSRRQASAILMITDDRRQRRWRADIRPIRWYRMLRENDDKTLVLRLIRGLENTGIKKYILLATAKAPAVYRTIYCRCTPKNDAEYSATRLCSLTSSTPTALGSSRYLRARLTRSLSTAAISSASSSISISFLRFVIRSSTV